MDYPKISIVTTCLNDKDYLEAAIESVLDQRYPNLEYIIIDGGSTDGSIDIIKKYENRLAYWVSERDNGHGHAVYKGLQKATGDIMTWLCSNDLFLPGSFETVARVFSELDIDLIYGYCNTIDIHGNLIRDVKMKVGDFHKALVFGQWVPPQHSCFWTRRLYTQCQVNPAFLRATDLDFFLRASSITKAYCVEEVLSSGRVHPPVSVLEGKRGIESRIKAWSDFVKKEHIPLYELFICGLYWKVKLRYVYGGLSEVFQPVRFGFLKSLSRLRTLS